MEVVNDFVNNHTYIRNDVQFNFADTTKKNHVAFLKRYLEQHTLEDIKDIELSKRVVYSFSESKNLHKRWFGCLASFCKYQFDKTGDSSWNLNKQYNNLFTETQNNIVSADKPDVPNIDIKIVNNLPETNYNEMRDKIILLYHLGIPLRSDLVSIKKSNFDKETDNYFEEGKLVFNCIIKTKRRIVQEVDLKLNELILKSFSYNESDYLILDNNGNPFSSKVYSNKIRVLTKRILGQEIGINMFRKIAVSKELNQAKTNDGLRSVLANNISKQMGNSENTVLRYYSSNIENSTESSSSSSKLLQEDEQKPNFVITHNICIDTESNLLNNLSINLLINGINIGSINLTKQ